MYTSDNSTYSLTQHENSVPSMLSYRALTVYIYIYIYIYIYMLNVEDDIVDLLLEHHYFTTPYIYLYLVCWFVYLASLGDQYLFLTYPLS